MNEFTRKRSSLAYGTAALLLTLSLAGTAAAEDATVALTLKEAIRSAAEKNLDVRAELYNPAMAEADLGRNRGIYDPNLTAQSNQSNYGEDTYQNRAAGSAIITTQKTFNLNTGISQLIPWGGTLALAFNNGWARTESNSFVNESFQNSLTLSVSQPLLKNFGRESTELNITLAATNKTALLNQFRTKLTDVIAQVRTEYYKLYSLREDLEVKKISLALAEKILDETRARVKAGVLPAMEILSAEFTVSTREKEVIDAERLLSDERDLLRTLIQTSSAGALNPVDAPYTASVALSEKEAIENALRYRPELQQLHDNLKNAELLERISRNQTRPDLSLVARGGVVGIDHNYATQWETMGRVDYPTWQVGFTFSYPLGNTAAENDYIRSRLQTEQIRTQIRSLEESVANEVRTAIRAVQSGYKQLDVTKRGSAYAEENLNAYIKKAAVGLATTKDVFEIQNNLVTAKGAEIQARAGYDTALTRFWKATGELLVREGITINGREADALYGKMK